MLRAFFRPAEEIGFRFDFDLRGPGIVAIFAEEFSFEATERGENSRDSAPKKMPAELRIFDARGGAFRTDDRMAQSPIAGMPLVEQPPGVGLSFFGDAQANSGQWGREKIPLLEIA